MNSVEKGVVLLGFSIRYIILTLFPDVSIALDNSIQFSTLTSSFRSLKEGIFLYTNGIDVYDGGVVHHQPLVLYLCQYFIDFSSLWYSLFDSLIIALFIKISQKNSHKNGSIHFKPWFIGLVYAINPISVLSALSKSTVIFSNFFILLALDSTLSNNWILSAISITIASYISFNPVYLIIPLLKLTFQVNGNVQNSARYLLVSIASGLMLVFASYKINNDNWDFISATTGTVIKFDKIEPNMGLWWYFFTEMFEFFIPFFNAVFNIYGMVFVVPLTIRLNGLFAFITSLGWITMTKSYPTLGDFAIYLNLLLLLKPVYIHLKLLLVSFLLLFHSIILSPIFYHLWIDLGSGNSNFFYAITLAYGLGIGATVTDFTWAYLHYEYDDGKPNPSLKLTQI